jgi:potassium-transporting ATPase KdpC subunit
MLRNQLRPAIALTFVLMLLTGVLYPGVVTALAQVLFPRQANGSMIESHGQLIGSELIGQSFSSPAYFHPRPSAAGSGYVGDSSGGSNKSQTDRALADTLVARAAAIKGPIPPDMITSSASGLDPHISPANAALQVARVAQERHVSPDQVRSLVAAHTERRQLGFFGEPRVNVLLLNLALDSLTH